MDFLLTRDKGHPLRSVEPKQQLPCLRIKAKMMVSVTGACTPSPDGNEAISGGFCDRDFSVAPLCFPVTDLDCLDCVLFKVQIREACRSLWHREDSEMELRNLCPWHAAQEVLAQGVQRPPVKKHCSEIIVPVKPSLLFLVDYALSECMFSKKMSIRVTAWPMVRTKHIDYHCQELWLDHC